MTLYNVGVGRADVTGPAAEVSIYLQYSVFTCSRGQSIFTFMPRAIIISWSSVMLILILDHQNTYFRLA